MSDLLIRNFDLPTYGYREIRIYQNGDITEVNECGLDDVVGTAEYLPPHGRLGDLDALAERIDGIWDCNDMVFRPNDKICKIPEDCKGCKRAQTKDCIQRMVENTPTIIQASEEGEA